MTAAGAPAVIGGGDSSWPAALAAASVASAGARRVADADSAAFWPLRGRCRRCSVAAARRRRGCGSSRGARSRAGVAGGAGGRRPGRGSGVRRGSSPKSTRSCGAAWSISIRRRRRRDNASALIAHPAGGRRRGPVRLARRPALRAAPGDARHRRAGVVHVARRRRLPHHRRPRRRRPARRASDGRGGRAPAGAARPHARCRRAINGPASRVAVPPDGASPRCASSKPPGAAVHVAAVDVADEAQLRAFLERYAGRSLAADPRRGPRGRAARQPSGRAHGRADVRRRARGPSCGGRNCSIGCCPTSICSCCSRPPAPSSRSPARPTMRRPMPASTRSRTTAARAVCRR